MPRIIQQPARIEAEGTPSKTISEFAGRLVSGHTHVSVAHMQSPQGWQEPGQRPEFEEITVVLRGVLRVQYAGGVLEVREGQAIITAPNEWIRYSTPEEGGAEYIAICVPAFSRETVHRDAAELDVA